MAFAQPPAGARGSLNSPEALPTSVEEVTAEWFTGVLGVPVAEAKLLLPIHGTASKLLFELTYTNESDAASQPKNVCVKGGFMPELMKLHPGLTVVYRREADFWHYIAPRLADAGMRLPASFYSGSDTVAGQGLAILDDLQNKGFTFGEPTQAWPVERVRLGVEQLAILHAKTWGKTHEDFPWLNANEGAGLHAVILTLMTESEWNARFHDDPAARPKGIPDWLVADRERMIRAFKTMWATHNPKYLCVAHGDAHIGNTFIGADDKPGFLDWQTWMPSYSALHDVAYFISGALEIEDRRKNEGELFEHWLRSLEKAGGPKLEKEEVWDDYRKHMMHGFAWCLTNPMMQPKDRIDAMSERHCAAIVDHGSLELLETLPGYVTEA